MVLVKELVLCHFATKKFEKAYHYHVAIPLCRRCGGHKIIISSVANASPRHFLGWYVINSIATADQKPLTKFENLEDGGIKLNPKRCKYGAKTMQTFRSQCGSAD